MCVFYLRTIHNKMNTQYGNEALEGNDKLAYDFSQQSYKKANERTNVGDYEYDASLSNVDTGVWHNNKTKKTHVSNRGSTSAPYYWLVSYAQIATAYGAKMACSCRHVAERPMESCLTDFTVDISQITFDETADTVRASVLGGLVSSEARKTGPETGCTLVEK